MGVKLGLTAEQVGLKTGMLISALFPILGIAVVLVIMRYFRKGKKSVLPIENISNKA